MPGARRSLASPVVSGVLCPCGSPHGSLAESGGGSGSSSGGSSSSSGGGGGGSCGRSVCEASEQDRRLRALFQKLDVNRDGALCIHDLAVGLGRLGLHRTELDLLLALCIPFQKRSMRILRRGGLWCTEVEEGQRLRTEGGYDENLGV
ncbi:calcium-binding carrier protein SCaMC-2-like protein [Willisornis vidua]|uniref:Calcium-binding carrier protein SCaMC-2-like protein n=1 Tax=Willisornis vidua TaxID=1566151 RepID=A0ABQ9D3K8_9PASS|nr:calcium-binding carrier protein SCaMC-2-like protein [Willisornis vidua]